MAISSIFGEVFARAPLPKNYQLRGGVRQGGAASPPDTIKKIGIFLHPLDAQRDHRTYIIRINAVVKGRAQGWTANTVNLHFTDWAPECAPQSAPEIGKRAPKIISVPPFPSSMQKRSEKSTNTSPALPSSLE